MLRERREEEELEAQRGKVSRDEEGTERRGKKGIKKRQRNKDIT